MCNDTPEYVTRFSSLSCCRTENITKYSSWIHKRNCYVYIRNISGEKTALARGFATVKQKTFEIVNFFVRLNVTGFGDIIT